MKVSIIIINYNDKIRIRRAIDSAINQTYKDIEVIVIDDGSDDETRAIYKNYENIKYIQLERKDEKARTPSRARNRGIDSATGDYACFLDSDNYYSKSFIEELMKHKTDVMFCNWEIIGLENYKIEIEKIWNFNLPILQNYLKFQCLDHQCLIIKKEYLDKIGKYDERLPRSQDCDMIIRLILGEGKWCHIPIMGFHFEKHESDQTKSIASIYGKTLWTLKNNINICWILGLLNDPLFVLSFNKAINDFMHKGEWQEDYKNSDFKKLIENHNNELYNQLLEKVEGKNVEMVNR